MSMSWDAVFCDGYTIYDFYEVVENFDTSTYEEEPLMVVDTNEEEKVPLRVEIPTPTSSCSKSPKRRTFGAQFADLKEEIADLKLEIEVKNTQIFAMLYEIYNLKRK